MGLVSRVGGTQLWYNISSDSQRLFSCKFPDTPRLRSPIRSPVWEPWIGTSPTHESLPPFTRCIHIQPSSFRRFRRRSSPSYLSKAKQLRTSFAEAVQLSSRHSALGDVRSVSMLTHSLA